MLSLKVWGQGSGAPAYRQVVQRPLPQCVREGLEPDIANIVVAEPHSVEGWERPTGQCACKSHKAGIAKQIRGQIELRVKNMQEKIQRKCEKGRNG